MNSNRSINYTGKDFSSFKQQLLEFAKNYFPDSYTDFTVPSPGTMFMEMAAYVGDVLSFYQDIQVQETFLEYAKNPANLYAMAYMMGYRPKVTTVAEAEMVFTQRVLATGSDFHPDWNSTIRINPYSQFRSVSANNINFLLRDTVDFSFSSSYDPTEIYIGGLDENNEPGYYELVKRGVVFSGEVREAIFNFGEYKKFQTIEITDSNIVGILEVTEVDKPEEKWTEVPFLGQDTVFEEERVTDRVEASKEGTAYALRLRKVPKRFVTRFTSTGTLQMQFGAGMHIDDADEENFLPNPISLEPNTQEVVDRYDVAYDPSNFLFSKSYGLAPVNVSLRVKYIVGGGLKSNVPAETLTQSTLLNLQKATSGDRLDLDDLYLQRYNVEGLTFTNPAPAYGGRNGDTLEEVRENAIRSFAEQKRVVTLKDFNVRALSMPQKFGAISKVYAVNEPLTDVQESALLRNPLAITLYVLSLDAKGHLTPASELIKENLRQYLSEYMMITDAIDLKDAFIINVGFNYDVVLRPGFQSRDVLLRCNEAIQEYMKVENRAINEPINLSDLYTILDKVEGVQTVKNIEVKNLTTEDGDYSKYSYGISSATRNNVIYPSFDPCIFELKFPEVDILGRAVALS